MARYRIVTDIEVPDVIPEATVQKIAADTAMNFRWALQREPQYSQDLPRMTLSHRGVRRLDPPAPVQSTEPEHLQTRLGPA